jgi:hypothetical protein
VIAWVLIAALTILGLLCVSGWFSDFGGVVAVNLMEVNDAR